MKTTSGMAEVELLGGVVRTRESDDHRWELAFEMKAVERAGG